MRLRVFGQLSQVFTVARWFEDMKNTPMLKDGVYQLIMDITQLPTSVLETDELNVILKIVGSREEVDRVTNLFVGYFDICHVFEFEKEYEDKEIVYLHISRIDMSKVGKKEDGREITVQHLIKWRDWQFNKIKQSIY